MADLGKKIYWKKRSTEKLLSAYSASNVYLKEAKEFLYHANIWNDKLAKAFSQLDKQFTNISRVIRDS